jgi:N utilization substance protein A
MARRNKQSDDTNSMKIGEFTSAIMQIAEEKGISREVVIETIEAALAAAYKKDYGKRGQHIRAEFDEVTGDSKFFLVKEVVDETTREMPLPDGTFPDKALADADDKSRTDAEILEGEEEKLSRLNPERDLTLEEAKKLNKSAKVGDIIETELETRSDFGRVAAQTAKQVIIQRIREAERDSMFKEYKEKEGEVINGIVQRIEGRNVYIDLGKSIGVLFPSEQIESEQYRIGQRMKVYLAKVEADPKGPGIVLSRSHPEIIKKLFALEVPEIFSGAVEIKAIAREAGSRTKIAVSSNEEGVDPIGSCVGQKGTRVQAVIDELGGEKIDIIEWNDDAEKFISAALSPAKVLAVTLDEENKIARVLVPEDQLSLAIGKRGQNVRLAAKLTGWKIDVAGDEKINAEKEQKEKEETEGTEKEAGEKEEEKKTEKIKEEEEKTEELKKEKPKKEKTEDKK